MQYARHPQIWIRKLSLGTSRAFAAQLADSTRNSQRIELADVQLARKLLQGTRTSRTPTRS
eukprot:9303898-Alexandrium_andersonii.AAC.1